MFRNRAAGAAFLFLAGASAAIACGPFFPWQLLDVRSDTLTETPHNSFVFEASHLVSRPQDNLKTDEPEYYDNDQRSIEMHSAELKGLSSEQQSRISVMRSHDDDASAYQAGDGLPDAVRLYTTGAVDFGAHDFQGAAKRFAAVLALAPAERAARGTWAAYMAGRAAALRGDNAQANAMYALTRKLASEGAPDPLGLAVASYGEEARIPLERGTALLTPPPAHDVPAPGQPIPENPDFKGYMLDLKEADEFRAAMTSAATLYAQQAAYNSNGGVQSLRIIAETILADPERIDASVSSPLLERLVVDYVLARTADDPGHDSGANDAGMGPPDPKPDPVLPVLVDAIVKFGGPDPAGSDRLAALSYLVGRYDLAAQMAEKSASPLAEWVKAKLALQKGDLASAQAHYAQATKGFPRVDETGSLDSDNANLILGESGTLALARGEYVDALDKLYPVAATYWGDVAYIAERVLTVDELKAFVDSKAGTPPRKPSASNEGPWAPPDPVAQLRNLLARRLMREGRYAEALDYFADPKLRAEAFDYATALHEGETDWFPIARAEAYFRAARLARLSGMEILGYEVAPDYGALGGSFDGGMGQDKPKGKFVTPGEIARAAASTAKPDLRFHYRYIAVDEASQAADLVPARSQAFAAILCRANGWMQQTPGEQPRVRAIYKTYVARGPRVAWATHFGWNCPDPDFVGAAALEHKQVYRYSRHYVSAHRWWFAGGTLVFALGLAGLLVTALPRRMPPKPPS